MACDDVDGGCSYCFAQIVVGIHRVFPDLDLRPVALDVYARSVGTAEKAEGWWDYTVEGLYGYSDTE